MEDYHSNVLTSSGADSNALQFAIYLNNTFFETPESLTLQIEDYGDSPFTSYFNLSSGSAMDTFYFNTSNPAHTVDQLKVSSSVVYVKEAPVGEYQAQLMAIVNVRRAARNAVAPENLDNSTITISVTTSKPMSSVLVH